jgi:2-keto-4-pentenoate hydratase/2-oxohepta-3-ene-1,7-dioic acid hydratase in catechol pathway
LKLTAEVDGELRQSGNTADMIFDIPTIIEFVTQVYTLLPGDVILTGTPAGIGPMPEGSITSLTIEGIGRLSNPIIRRSKKSESSERR